MYNRYGGDEETVDVLGAEGRLVGESGERVVRRDDDAGLTRGMWPFESHSDDS